MKSSFPSASEYFATFNLEEGDVVKFRHHRDVKELTLIVCPGASHNFEAMTPLDRERFHIESPYVDVHKLVFKGVSEFRREDPISNEFRDREEYEESPSDETVLVIYGIQNKNHKDNFDFNAVLSGFGEVTFNYCELEVEFKKVIEKVDSNGHNSDRLYFDVEMGNVGHIPELFNRCSFNVGDSVRLKSGGPEMTIKSVSKKNGELLAECTWFDYSSIKNSDEFSVDMLLITHGLLDKKSPIASHHK